MAIYRTLFYKDVKVGSNGRLTIPLDVRSECGIEQGDELTVRVDEDSLTGVRQLVMWRKEHDSDD